MHRIEQQGVGVVQLDETRGWGISQAVIVGVVGYTGLVLAGLLSMFVVYSTPSWRPIPHFYELDTEIYVFFAVLGAGLFAGPLVIWFVRKQGLEGLRQSIGWSGSKKMLGWSFALGFALGIALSLAKSAILGQSYQSHTTEFVLAFVLLGGLAQPIVEEVYFRGILFVALAKRVGNIPAACAVTPLFCLVHPKHFLTVLPVAVLLGLVRLYTDSVKACFACHAAYNLSLVLFMLPISR